MNKYVFRSLIILIGLAFLSIGVALAHGTPVVAVQPTVAPAGGQITVTGSEMEAGETFTITLEGPTGSTHLSTVTAVATTSKDQMDTATPQAESTATPDNDSAQSGEPQEGGFTVAYTIPDKTPPGPYTVKATGEDGDATETDLTITAASTQASAAPATAPMPSGELHEIDRSRPASQLAGVFVLVVVSGGLGVLKRSDAPVPDSVIGEAMVYLANAWSMHGAGLFDQAISRNVAIAAYKVRAGISEDLENRATVT